MLDILYLDSPQLARTFPSARIIARKKTVVGNTHLANFSAYRIADFRDGGYTLFTVWFGAL
jgi:hypothetical protein